MPLIPTGTVPGTVTWMGYSSVMLDFDDGVHWIGTDIFVDSRRSRERGIVSHAHADHVGRHRRWISSPATAALCARRWGAPDLEVHRFHESWDADGAKVTLLPAGHILGSSMVLVERGGTRVLYTGDFRLKPAVTAEPCVPVSADVLVMECTFGDPRYRFPDRLEVLDLLCDFVEETLAMETVPILLAYSLGKAQELASLLAERGVRVWLHDHAWAMLEVYQEFGHQFPGCRRFEMEAVVNGALILPPGPATWPLVRSFRRRRVAAVTGWALDSGRLPRCDAAFPISDHADFDELLELVDRVRPRKIYTLHGPDRFAARLRSLGRDAEPASLALQGSLF
jgi:Cft2 family RNA processing exonuclease